MKKNCRFCGGLIYPDAKECKHCGKVLIASEETSANEGSRTVSLDSWKQKSVPAWLMYLLVGICLFCIWIMYARGCEKNEAFQRDLESQNEPANTDVIPVE